MNRKTIYVLHKNGAPSHYYALEHLAKQHGYIVKYREFSIFSKFYKGIVKGRWALFSKQLTNALFLVGLFFSKNKKIVLGIAPFDSKLKSLMAFLKNHQIFYHTSWTCWDKSFHPKMKKNTAAVFDTWRTFLEEKCSHIFTVTKKSKVEILSNYVVEDHKISVVYHSLHPAYLNHTRLNRTPNSFIYVGRITPEKGIEELLQFFSKHPQATLSILGEGKQEILVKEYAQKFSNIKFLGYIASKNELLSAFSSHQFLILNSKKTQRWEELFGLIIIEAMSQGTLPISSSHSGPKEIIQQSFGYLFEEDHITTTLATILEDNQFSQEMSDSAIKASKQYTTQRISAKWKAILNK